LTFDVREHHAEFGLFKDQDFSPASLACCRSDVIIHDEIIKSDDLCPNDSPMFDNVSIKGLLLITPRWGLEPICHLSSLRMSFLLLIRILGVIAASFPEC